MNANHRVMPFGHGIRTASSGSSGHIRGETVELDRQPLTGKGVHGR
jgi:hypothetical protein